MGWRLSTSHASDFEIAPNGSTVARFGTQQASFGDGNHLVVHDDGTVTVNGTLLVGTRTVALVGYGGMYLKDLTVTGVDHTFSGATFEKIDDFATQMAEGGAVSSSTANNELTLADAGDYEICIGADFDGSASQTLRCCVFLGADASESESVPCLGGRALPGTPDEGSASGQCAFVSVSAGDRVELHCQSANTKTVTWSWLSLSAEWAGP